MSGMSDSKISLGVGVAAAAIGLVAVIGLRWKAKSEEGLAPALDEAQTREIMKSLSTGLASRSIRFSNAAEKIKAQMQQQGQMLEDAQIMQHFIYPHFKTAVQEMEQKICDDYDIALYELEEAVDEYYSTDKEIEGYANDVRKLIAKFGGEVESNEVVPGGEAGSGGEAAATGTGGAGNSGSVESMLAIFEDLKERVLQATEEYATAHVAMHGPPADQQGAQEFQLGMVKLHTDIQNEVLSEYGVTEEEFTMMIQKNANSPGVQAAFMQMQMGIQQKLAQCGIGAM